MGAQLGWDEGSYIDDSWAVGADESGDALAQKPVFHLHHVLLWDALCDAHDQRYLGINGLNDGCRCKWRRNIDDCGIGSSGILGLTDMTGKRSWRPGKVVNHLVIAYHKNITDHI